ncbi:MAG: AMP-binding protein [Rhabdochlamydiaceae bacterium]
MMNCPLYEFYIHSPKEIVIKEKERELSAEDMEQFVEGMALTLLNLNMKAKDRIAIKASLHVKTIVFMLACLRLGVEVCLLNPRFDNHCLKKWGARFVDLESLTLEKGVCSLYQCDENQIAFLLETSGSTGNSKIAALSLNNFKQNASYVNLALNFQCRDSWALNLPLNHVGGLSIIFRCLLGFGKIFLGPQEESSTFVSVVPTHVYRHFYKEAVLKADHFLIGGAPLPHSLYEMLKKQSHSFFYSYGMTEMASLVSLDRSLSHCCGQVLPKRELRINQNQEILVKGDCLFLGYWTPEEGLKKSTDHDGWFHTGDLGLFDDKGNLYVKGRKDNLFICGGENIQPEEIEQIVHQIFRVEEAVVVPLEDVEFGFKPAICLSEYIPLSLIQEKLLEFLPKYKIPVSLYLIDSFHLKRQRNALKKTIHESPQTFPHFVK